MGEFKAEELRRYSRHILLPEVGIEGQQKLKKSSVLIVGIGGLGSPLALYLAASGIGRIGIVDYDTLDESNLQRQIIFNSNDLARSKVQAAKEKLLALNPFLEIELYPEKLTSENAINIIRQYDIVADGTDNFPTRYLVNDVCMILEKPNVYASIFGFEGQASVFSKGQGPCYRCLFPNPPTAGSVPSCNEAGVLGVLPGILGTIQATEVIKLILGIGELLIGRLLTYNALDMTFDEVKIQQNSSCPVCGDQAIITEPIDYDEFCNGSSQTQTKKPASEVKNMLPIELKTSLELKQDIFLLDIREQKELDICKLDQAKHIPMAEVPARLNELPTNKPIIVLCHLGIRSLNVVGFLTNEGFQNAYNLKGGIDAYAIDCDQSISRY